MTLYVDDNMFVIITGSKSIHLNLKNKVDNNLKYEIDHIIKHNQFLAEL